MSALLPTIAPNFTVSSPSSVASVNGTHKRNCRYPRPYMTQNTVTSRPSTVSSSTSNLVTKTTTKNQITALVYNAHVGDASFTLQTNAVSSQL